MKRFLLPLFLLFVTLTSSTAFADHIYLRPNDGSGDNFRFVGQMNGHPLVLLGGTPSYFFITDGYAPGSTFGGAATLFLYPTVVWIDGVPLEFDFDPTNSGIFMSSITLPTDDKSFTIPVQIYFDAWGINSDTGQTIQVGGFASGKIPVYFDSNTGLYYPETFVQAPEPGTLGFVGTGMIGILASVRKRLKKPRIISSFSLGWWPLKS